MTAPTSSAALFQPRRPIGDGIIVGMIGAAVVALFFLGVDLIRGQPFLTPSVLGEVFILGRPEAVTSAIDPTAVVYYSIAHLVVFAVFGVILSVLARRSEVSSLARYGVIVVFVAFELFFYGVLLIASAATRGLFPGWEVLAANLLAILAMTTWIWRHHPALRAVVGSTTLGAPDAARE